MASIFSTAESGGVLYVDGAPVVVFDAIQSVSDSLDTDATELPIERGVDVLDTAQPLPVAVNFVGSVTATPLDADDTTDTDRDKSAWEALRGLWRAGSVVSFATGSEQYSEMRVVRISRDQSAGGSPYALTVAVELRQVFFAEPERVTVPAQYVQRESGARAGATKPVDAGRQPPGDSTDAEKEKAEPLTGSALYRLRGARQ